MEKTHAMLAVTGVTLNNIASAQKRLKRKKWEEEKMLDVNLDSCLVSNSAGDWWYWTPVML